MEQIVTVADLLLKWIVVPTLAAVGWLVKKLIDMDKERNSLVTDVRVLETKVQAHADASKASYKSLQTQMEAVLKKLDGIESYLREKK
jgi:hypothetical protein